MMNYKEKIKKYFEDNKIKANIDDEFKKIVIVTDNHDKWLYFAKRVNENDKIINVKGTDKEHIEVTFDKKDESAYQQFYNKLLKKYYLVAPKLKYFSVLIKPTHRCNLDCKYCYDKPYREKIKNDMSFATLDRILKLLSEYTERLQLIWHGGEPTMVGIQWYIKAYEEVISKYPMLEIDSYIMSNGINYNEKWFNIFKQYKISPGMSYNAMYQEKLRVSNQKNQNSKADKKINQKLEDILKLSSEIGPKIGTIDVITKENYKDQIQIYEYYKKIGISTSMNMVFHTKQTEKNDLELSPEEYEKEFIKYFKYWLYDKNGAYERSAAEMLSIVIGDMNGATCRNHDCRYHWIGINPLGEIYPCDRYYPEKYKMTTVFDINSIDEVFITEGYKTYVKEIQQRFDTTCKKCGYWFACHGGCNASAIESTGSAAGVEKNYCEFFRRAYNDVYDVLRNVDIIHDKNLNPYARDIMINKGFYSVKNIYEVLRELGRNISLTYNKNDLLNCSEYKIFRNINFMTDTGTKYSFHVDIIKSQKTKDIKINEQKRKEDLIKYLMEVAKDAYNDRVSEFCGNGSV